MVAPSQLGIEILNAARRWAATRVIVKRVLDSKKASPEQVNKAKDDYRKASDDLENLIIKLEKTLKNAGANISKARGKSAPFPWKQVLGVIATGAKTLEDVLQDGGPRKIVDLGFIDTEAEVVETTTKKVRT